MLWLKHFASKVILYNDNEFETWENKCDSR